MPGSWHSLLPFLPHLSSTLQEGGPLDNLRVWIHEFGHAIVGWFGGHRAIPLGPPFGWTTIEPERSIVVYVAILFLLAVLFYTAWKEKLYAAMAVAAAFMLLQAKLTWATSPITLDELIRFGGVAGELYIGTLLMIAFYIRMPDRWRWDFWRFFVVVIAAVTFFHEYRFWHDVRWGRESIPWGSGLFGPDDENGDMNRLSWQFGWSDSRIITTYYSLANAGLLAIIIVYVWSLISLRVRQLSTVADEILPGDGQTHDWVVRSSMPKPDWQRFLTIRYRDNVYQMFKQNIGPKRRPFVYYLRKPPSGHLINAIREYNPEDVLKKS
jgi:hypothetical protein